MPPGTPHTVLTTFSCVALGMHFYNFDHLGRTFAAMVTEHFCGLSTVNANFTMAPFIFFKAVDSALYTIVRDEVDEWPNWFNGASFLRVFFTKSDLVAIQMTF